MLWGGHQLESEAEYLLEYAADALRHQAPSLPHPLSVCAAQQTMAHPSDRKSHDHHVT